MFDEYNICPYTGLRSFTEEESLYFKGRDGHMEQSTEMLEKHKFLMLTGASGDGKSSLVYAGIIPNARAGFLKASYTNWQVADFRPERSPFTNLCSAVARALDIPNPATVQSELQHGFSALVDLYKSSNLYADKSSQEWESADPGKRKEMQHQSANLLILADQFEEFFTNPENYLRGAPSNDANLTLNLLLETARIALQDDLPIYVVFTMRSDYIGQCAAFRGLPEYIGFSQFFVPRLNRKQLQEVIEEPAELSGNRISRRLTDRLIHDITEGVDQLPILQHALNQIWKAADEGKAELDLIHYAMVGGMADTELPEDQQGKFKEWFQALPKNIQDCYHSPGLHNVLDTHANKIYESAALYANEKTGASITADDAHLVIKTAFTCLTKIDHSRAVRNRMTLQEITDILGRNEWSTEIVAALIDGFREPGNTFIHPFILEGEEAKKLEPDTVLDITHESLIRNWEMLRDWADEEFDKFTTFADFKLQVDRWLEHDRSWGFLLPIGALTYFDDWYKETKPNAHWVNRYNEQVTETEKNLDESREIVENSEAFLLRSARKHVITRAVMRFGPRRIAAVFGILLVLVFSSFAVYNNIRKRNGFVLNQIKNEGRAIVNRTKARPVDKAFFIINMERTEPGSAIQIMESIEDKYIRLETTIAVATDLTLNDPRLNHSLGSESVLLAADLAEDIYSLHLESKANKAQLLALTIELTDVADLAHLYRREADLKMAGQRSATLIGKLVLDLVRSPWAEMQVKEVNEGIEIALNHHIFSREEIHELITRLSPFEDSEMVGMITSFYTSDKVVLTGIGQYRISSSGLYQILGSLYAAQGKVDEVMMAGDTLRKYHFLYEDFTTDAYTMAGYFASFGHWDALKEFASRHAEKLEARPFQIYRRILDRTGKAHFAINARYKYKNFGQANRWVNPLLEFLPDSIIDQLYEEYQQSIINNASIGNERNYYLAMYNKQLGVALARKYQDRGIQDWEPEIFALFDKSHENYSRVTKQYLEEKVDFWTNTNARKNVYLWPDYIEAYAPIRVRSIPLNYYTDAFLKWMLERGHFSQLYSEASDFDMLRNWIHLMGVGSRSINGIYWAANDVTTGNLAKYYFGISQYSTQSDLNLNELRLILASSYFNKGDTEAGISVAQEVDPGRLQDLLTSTIAPLSFSYVADVYGYLASNGEAGMAWSMMQAFTDKRNQSRLYDVAAVQCFADEKEELGSLYVDSAAMILNSISDPAGGHYISHIYALALQGNPDAISESRKLLSSLFSFGRLAIAYPLVIRATARNEQYYNALTAMPIYSDIEAISVINQMLYGLDYYEEGTEWSAYDYTRDWSYFATGVSF